MLAIIIKGSIANPKALIAAITVTYLRSPSCTAFS
jgi:hypothetical protein